MAAADAGYISHSELMFGRADTPATWADDLPDQLLSELETLASGEDADHILVGATIDGTLVAWAIVAFERDVQHPFATIEDLVVDRSIRERGIGTEMLNWIEHHARERNIERLFLESGLANEGAHRFFEANRFAAVSKVMMRELTPAGATNLSTPIEGQTDAQD